MTKTIDFKPGEPSFALETLHVMSEHEKNVAVDTGDDVLYMNFILSEVSGFRRFQNSGFLKTSKTRNQNPIRQRDLQESPDTMSVHHTSKDEVPRCSGSLLRLDFVRFFPRSEISAYGRREAPANLCDRSLVHPGAPRGNPPVS